MAATTAEFFTSHASFIYNPPRDRRNVCHMGYIGIPYSGYNFKEPELTEDVFCLFKKMLQENPDMTVPPMLKPSYLKNSWWELTCVAIGLVGLYFEKWCKDIGGVIYIIDGIVIFIGIAMGLSLMMSTSSFLRYTTQQEEYYTKLMAEISQAETFSDFIYNKV